MTTQSHSKQALPILAEVYVSKIGTSINVDRSWEGFQNEDRFSDGVAT